MTGQCYYCVGGNHEDCTGLGNGRDTMTNTVMPCTCCGTRVLAEAAAHEAAAHEAAVAELVIAMRAALQPVLARQRQQVPQA
jgi:hypothetical protein